MIARVSPILFSLSVVMSGGSADTPPPGAKEGALASLSTFLQRGTGGGSMGTAVNFQANRDASDPGLAWGYLEASYETAPWNGLTLGATALGVSRIWENHPGDFASDFSEDWDLRDLFLAYDFGETDSGLIAGRKAYSGNPVLDGDSQEGAGITLRGGNGITAWGGAFHRWIDNSSPKYDADGISGWKDVSDANPEAGDVFLAGRIDLPLGRQTVLSPFAAWQENVLGVYGLKAGHSLPLSPDALPSWDSEVILAYYDNGAPSSVDPGFENVWSGRIHTGYVAPTWSAGAGFYWIGDGTIDTTAGLFNSFDPLKEDDLYPFNSRNDTHLFYLDGSLALGALTLEPAVGLGRNDAVGSDSLEIDLLFTWDLPGSFKAAGYLVHVDFEKEVLPNYTVVGVSLAYDF